MAPHDSRSFIGSGNWLFRLQAFLAPRARIWGLLIPIHLAAFFLLYLATARLLETELVTTVSEISRRQLNHEIEELRAVAGAHTEGMSEGHRLADVLDIHSEINFRLFLPGGTSLGAQTEFSGEEHQEMVAFLMSGQQERFWLENEGKNRRMRALSRLVAEPGCTPCHQEGQTLAVATMFVDLSQQMAAVRTHSRRNLAFLIVAWGGLVGLTTGLAKYSVRRATQRLEADLAAAEAGESGEIDPAPALVFDPVSAELQRSLRRFLRRQREREAEVASRLAHTNQLASLGELAAGLAHEIKNPLAGIHGALEILREDARDDASTGRLYDEMLGELQRVNQTLQTLLASARPSPPRLADTDLRQLLEEVRRFMSPSLRLRKVDLRLEMAPGALEARIDPGKIRQVLINLINNAAEATEEGGRVTLRAGGFPQDEGVIVAVQDDGPGIPAEHLRRIFDPFFTTKFSGTGLGLAIAKSLVEQHGGSLQVESEPDGGTTFFLLLPPQAAARVADADRMSAE